MYNICNERKITVAEANGLGWRFTFERWFSPDLSKQMNG
jgi:hypothetical protein